jgi:hypothetical protein
MPQSHTTDTAGGIKYTSFSQFIAGSNLAVGRLCNGIFDYFSLGLLIKPIFQIGLSTVLVDQGINAAFVNGGFLSIKCISRKTHEPTCMGHIAQFLCQI